MPGGGAGWLQRMASQANSTITGSEDSRAGQSDMPSSRNETARFWRLSRIVSAKSSCAAFSSPWSSRVRAFRARMPSWLEARR